MRFRLKTLLLIVSVVACLMGIAVRNVHLQKRAISIIHDNGGVAYYDYEIIITSDGWTIPKHIPPSKLRNLVGPEWLHEIVAIEFDSIDFTESDLESLSALASVQKLVIYQDRFSSKERSRMRSIFPKAIIEHFPIHANYDSELLD